jgi:hypothetical protein
VTATNNHPSFGLLVLVLKRSAVKSCYPPGLRAVAVRLAKLALGDQVRPLSQTILSQCDRFVRQDRLSGIQMMPEQCRSPELIQSLGLAADRFRFISSGLWEIRNRLAKGWRKLGVRARILLNTLF